MKDSTLKKPKKRRFLRGLMVLISIIFSFSLILSYMASYISPDKIWVIAFFGIIYPFLLLINFFLLIYWLFSRRVFFLLHLIIILIGWTHLRGLICIHYFQKHFDKTNSIKVLSYNVRNFDIYNYNKDWTFNFEKRDKIFDFIRNESADIICFQEFSYEVSGKFATLDTLIKLQKAVNYQTEYTSNPVSSNIFGVATFSIYPIINKGKISFGKETNNVCIFSDVIINNDTVRIYNVHFESIKLGREDYNLAEDISHINKPDGTNQELKKKSVRLLRRMKNAFIKRASQARLVALNIENCRYPVILCGDFNDTPTSYVYHLISSRLVDSFRESGSGLGQSYIGLLPTFRIDYIFHSKEFESNDFNTIHYDYSDHYPIECYLKSK